MQSCDFLQQLAARAVSRRRFRSAMAAATSDEKDERKEGRKRERKKG
jgi:hypothetical protein